LDVSGHDYCDIDSDAFAALTSLEELYLGQMKLRSIDPNMLSQLTKLKTLDLHGNLLKKLAPTMFSPREPVQNFAS
jgi:Leucine-rich repeat (LRR) protein